MKQHYSFLHLLASLLARTAFLSALTFATRPIASLACVDDLSWYGRASVSHDCDYVGLDPEIRCNWVSAEGESANEACRQTCDPSCSDGGTPSAPTKTPTKAPTPPPSVTNPVSPTPGPLVSNLKENPQVLSDTSAVCSDASGRTSKCEVELDVPASCVSNGQSTCPIVFFLHGAGGTNNWFGRTSGVHSAGFIGVYPQGENGWNTGPKDTNVCSWDDFVCDDDPDEGAFIAGIISELRAQGAAGNVYVIGSSNGGALANRLASNAGGNLPIKGIVSLVTQLMASPERSGPGVLNYNYPRTGGVKVSVLNVMGTGDSVIPYTGGSSSVFSGVEEFQLMSALDSMEFWADHNGCDLTAESMPITTDIIAGGDGTGTHYRYNGCSDGTIVEHYAINGGGHNAGLSQVEGVDVTYDIAFEFIKKCEASVVESPTPLPSSSPTAYHSSCLVCTDLVTPWMASNTYDCSTNWLINQNCNENPTWTENNYCQLSCFLAGRGYDGDICCVPPPSCHVCTDNVTPWMESNEYDCSTSWLINQKCNKDPFWVASKFCQQSCFDAGYGYEEDFCCVP